MRLIDIYELESRIEAEFGELRTAGEIKNAVLEIIEDMPCFVVKKKKDGNYIGMWEE